MSTKIHNGYRITGPDGSRPDPFVFATQLRAHLWPVYESAFTRALVLAAVTAVDAAEHAGKPAPDGPIATAWLGLHDRQKKIDATRERDPEADFQCDVTFLADPDDPTGPLYALLYTERPTYRATFERMPGVEPWPYWNNTDRPENLTDEEWQHRADTWDRVIGLTMAPITRGLSWKLLGLYDGCSPTKVRDRAVDFLPGRAHRARRLAADLVSVIVTDDTGAPVEPLRLRRAEDIRADRAALAAEVEPRLSEITVDRLYGREVRAS